MSNELLNISHLPAFSRVTPEQVTPAIDELLEQGRSVLAQCVKQGIEYTWDSLITPLDKSANQLERAWSVVSHLNAVVNTDSLRDAYNSNLAKLSEYHTELGQNQALYEAIRQVRENDTNLNDAQKKALDDSLLSFRLSGVALADDKKQRYRDISQQLSQLSAQFSDNVLDATNAWFKQITDENLLSGLPDSARAMAKQNAEQRELEGWVFTLEFPSYLAVMSYADNAELREEMYRAYNTRASDQADNAEWDNTQIMRDILRLRQEEAELLDYQHYADVSLASKMAESPEQVIGFLEDLAQRSKPFAENEFEELKAFAQQMFHMEHVNAWDVAYLSEKIKEQRFDFTEEDLKPYFPVDKVIQGLFELVSRLFNVRFEQVEQAIDTWHSDVRFYRLYDAQDQLQAEFYLDLYARQHKRGGAWMSDFCGRFRVDNSLQTPVAFMTCNGTPPVGDQPALFTHDEVVTLFHEFGHGLHHMLTQVEYLGISGISGVEWDAVELPSQFMENWCWEREVLNMISGHWETGEALPDVLFEKMKAARHFQSAMQMVRQLEFALFDLKLHMDKTSSEEGRLAEIVNQVREQVAVVEYPTYNRMPNSFSHIFAGGYAAGYYSYKWAEVLSADAYARFEEEGLFNAEIGLAFKQNILEVGGSREAMQSFQAFRGREPNIDALMRHSGLSE